MSMQNFGYAFRDDGMELSFLAVRGNGQLRTGLVAGDFTVTVVNPQDTASSTPVVSELTEKAGSYEATVPSTFLQAHGPGTYRVIIEIDTFAGPSGGPNIRAAFGGPVRVEDTNINSWIDAQPIKLSSGAIEVSAVLKRKGQIVTNATAATLSIRNNAGATLLTPDPATLSGAPNAHGAYVFTVTPSPALSQGTYTALLTITDPLGTVNGQVDILGHL